MRIKLGRFDGRLKDLSLIVGRGLTSNIYVIGEKEITLVDAGNGAPENRIAPELEGLGLDIKDVSQVIVTHLHHDHVNGIVELVEEASPRMITYKDDVVYLRRLGRGEVIGLGDGDVAEAPGYTLRVIYTPGHTMGSICLYDAGKRILFTGDTVFPNGSFGRVDHGSIEAMVESLGKLADLGVDIMLPGHDNPVYKDASGHIRLALEAARQYM